MHHRVVRVVMRDLRALCRHRCRNGEPRRMVVFIPGADISDDGIQDHAQNHKEQDGKQDAEQQVKSSEKHFTPPKFLPAGPLHRPEKLLLRACSS